MPPRAAGAGKGGKKGTATDSKGGLNPLVVVVVLVAVAAGAYFSRLGHK